MYIIRRPTERPPWVAECKVEYVSVEYLENGKKVVFSGYNFSATDRDIGNKVFFTREEAEQALKERSEKALIVNVVQLKEQEVQSYGREGCQESD